MNALYEQSTVREWFVRDRRGAMHQCRDENEARDLAATHEGAVVLWRDITTGPLTEAKGKP